jgi:hypothetical protein
LGMCSAKKKLRANISTHKKEHPIIVHGLN